MIHELLKTGRDNAQSARILCEELQITSRQLRKHIEHERRQGHPICASTKNGANGYFLAADQEEMKSYCKTIWQTINSLAKTCRACQRLINTLPASECGDSSEGNKQFSLFDLIEDNEI